MYSVVAWCIHVCVSSLLMSVALVLVVVALHVCRVCIGLVVVSPLVCSRLKFQDLVLSEEDLMPPPTPPSHTTRWRHPLALPLLLLALVGRWYAPSSKNPFTTQGVSSDVEIPTQ